MWRKEITKKLSELLERHLNPSNDSRIYTAKEVTFDYSSVDRVRVDYMQFKPPNTTISGLERGDFFCYEVKSSAEDFHSKHGHNFIGDYNYYVMPEAVYLAVKKEIPFGTGVYVADNAFTHLECVQAARRKNRNRSNLELLFMMYRSALRDLYKFKGSDKRD